MDFEVSRCEVATGAQDGFATLFCDGINHEIAEIQQASPPVTLAVVIAGTVRQFGMVAPEIYKFGTPFIETVDQTRRECHDFMPTRSRC